MPKSALPIEQLLAGHSFKEWTSRVVQELDRAVIRTLSCDFCGNSMQPLTAQFYRERIVAWQFLAVYDAFTFAPSTDHNLQRVKNCLWLRLMLLILVNSRWTALDVDAQTPLLICCKYGLHPVFYASVRGQSLSLIHI